MTGWWYSDLALRLSTTLFLNTGPYFYVFQMASTGDDCYFYYYSECKKAAYCPFRHSAPARGTEDICPDWKQGKCSIPNCPRRHMIIQVSQCCGSDSLAGPILH